MSSLSSPSKCRDDMKLSGHIWESDHSAFDRVLSKIYLICNLVTSRAGVWFRLNQFLVIAHVLLYKAIKSIARV